MWITNAQLVLTDRVEAGAVQVEGGRIARVKLGAQAGSGKDKVDLQGAYLAPGFIDLHIHGGLRRDTMEATEDAFRTITAFHLRGGTTSLTLTSLTASEGEILRVLAAVQPLLNKSLGGARILGVHLEGPFISKEKAGAQDPRFIRDPDPAEWKKYLAYGKLVTQMTLAPELPGAVPLMRALRRNGSIVSAGHTNANETELLPALRAGLNQTTHTFNCMSTAIKRGPERLAGAVEFALAHDEISCELIADGRHVGPVMMRMLFKAKGAAGVCLITDAIGGAGLPAGTKYRFGEAGGIEVLVTRNAAVLADGSALAGSTLTMMEAVRRSVQLGGISLPEAVRMASGNPARQLKREAELGSIAPGRRADLVAFDRNYRVQRVWLDGEPQSLARIPDRGGVPGTPGPQPSLVKARKTP